MDTRFPCPCCGNLTLEEAPPGTYLICELCHWEDDPVQFDDPDYRGGANHESLNEARRRWLLTSLDGTGAAGGGT